MENLAFFGELTATSNKQHAKFVGEVATKTAYIVVEDEKTIKALKDFGLTQYTPEPVEGETARPYFIIKMAKKIDLYIHGKIGTKEMSGEAFDSEGRTTHNLKSKDSVLLGFNVIKGEKDTNEFYRLQAIMLNDVDDLEKVEKTNPFLDIIA